MIVRTIVNASRTAKDAARAWLKRAMVRARFAGLQVKGPSVWEYDRLDAFDIADGVWVGPFTEIVAYSHSARSRVPGKLVLKRRAVVSTGANLRAAGGVIEIGEDSGVGQGCVVVASNHRIDPDLVYIRSDWREDVTGVIIGDNVWIGANSVLLPGITIGDHAVVGAGSVVNRSIPVGELWGGVPARFIRKLR